MISNPFCLTAAILNCSGFAWGMSAHFQRAGAPSKAMKLTALLAAASTSLQLYALAARPAWHTHTALALYAASAALYWSAIAHTRGKLAACGQGITSRQLVQSGPYRVVRHPFYTAYNLTWIAGLAATGWAPLIMTVVVMAAVYERSARAEEAGFLQGPLALEYLRYKRRAGRYLPGLSRRWWLRVPDQSNAID